MWTPPKLNKALARQIAKNVGKDWAIHVKSLDDIRDAIGKGIVTPMSMSDRVDNQADVKAWKAKIPTADLHQMFRWVEEIKSGKASETYRMTDEALRKLRASTMRIASPNELQAELKAIMAFVHASEKPDRQVVAAKIRELADRVAASPRMVGKTPDQVAKWLLDNTLKTGQKVRIWVGRGKDDYHEGTVTSVKLWPKPGDKAFDRENLTGRVNREDKYTIKYDGEPAYPGEPREGDLSAKGTRSGDTLIVTHGKGRTRVHKLGLL